MLFAGSFGETVPPSFSHLSIASSIRRVLRIMSPIPLGMTPILVTRTPSVATGGTLTDDQRRTARRAYRPLNVVDAFAGRVPGEPRTRTFRVGR